ncbi:MAG: ATP-binding protein, partial [Puniceicoccales bacterium]
MGETAEEVGARVDLQRSRMDIDLGGPLKAIQDAKFLSTASLSSDRFRNALLGIVRGNESIRSIRVLDKAGDELLVVAVGEREDEAFESSAEVGGAFSDEFLEELRSLSEGEEMISGFSVLVQKGQKIPTVLIGTGLFFPSGARAGYIVADVNAEYLMDDVLHLFSEEHPNFFIISSDGRWIYDSRSEDPWRGLRDETRTRWLVDEFPEVWRAMISTGDGVYSNKGLWIFREHTPLETIKTRKPRTLSVGAGAGDSISVEPFYVVKHIEGGPSWREVWMAMIPILILAGLALILVIPAILRRREALRVSEKATRDLREASLRTRMAMEAAGISELRIDLDEGTVEADRRIAGMLMLGPGESIQTVEDWENRLHPQDKRKVIDQLEPLWLDGKGTFSIRHRMKRGDGTWGWFRFRGAVRNDDLDDRKFILGAYIDLTDVVLRDEELNRLEMATRQTLSGIAILDNEGVLEWANPAFRNHVQRRGVNLVGEPIWDLFVLDGGDVEEEKEGIRTAILRGEEFSLLVSIAIPGTEVSWCRVVGNPVLDEGGIPTHYVVIESDISREMRAEADLRKSESLLSESQRLAEIGSWEIDLEEGSTYWSEEIYRMFGISRDVIPDSEMVLALFEEEDREMVENDLKKAIETGEGFQRELRFKGKDGEERWALSIGMALREANVTTKVYGVTQDISSQKDAERALIRAKEEAEGLNEQLANALDKAHQSEQKAQQASEAKSSFLSMISHEIRNPLNGVIGMADLLKQTRLDEIQADYVDTIHSSGSTVVMLLDDILDFNRLEHGKIMFEQKEFAVEAAIEDSVLFFSHRMVEKGLDFGYWIDPEVPARVTGDITRLKQILFNLLGNAVKFTEEGSITLEVELRERRPNDRCLLLFTVRDTGIGIPKDRHDRIFQSFSQVDPSITRKFGGSGLGLAISKELSLRMGGDIEFESDTGHGACFEVLLPFPASFEEYGSEKKRIGGRAIGWFALKTREKQVRTILEDLDISVDMFSTEEEMLRAIAGAGPADRILLDYEYLIRPEVFSAFTERKEGLHPVIVVGVPGQTIDTPFQSSWLVKPVSRKRVLAVLQGEAGKRKVRTVDPVNAEQAESHNDMKILVAEDNLVNQKVIRLLLKRMGYDCTVVENGAIAVDQVLKEKYDLVLMDIQMPEMDGIEASGHIVQEVPESIRPRIVALTAGATRDNREDAEEAGMDGYLTKPVQASALEAELRATAE